MDYLIVNHTGYQRIFKVVVAKEFYEAKNGQKLSNREFKDLYKDVDFAECTEKMDETFVDQAIFVHKRTLCSTQVREVVEGMEGPQYQQSLVQPMFLI